MSTQQGALEPNKEGSTSKRKRASSHSRRRSKKFSKSCESDEDASSGEQYQAPSESDSDDEHEPIEQEPIEPDEPHEADEENKKYITKCIAAGKIVNQALKSLILECKPQAKVVHICDTGDKLMIKEGEKCYKRSAKGVAFPTSISRNHQLSNFNPNPTDELKAHDIVKINMGFHIDQCAVELAHTHVVTTDVIPEGKTSNVIGVVEGIKDYVLKVVKVGTRILSIKKDQDIHDFAHTLECTLLQIDISELNANGALDTQTENGLFEKNKGYVFNILASTGNGQTEASGNEQATLKEATLKGDELVAQVKFVIFFQEKGTKKILPPKPQKITTTVPCKIARSLGSKYKNLTYCGKINLGEEGSGFIPKVNYISWYSGKAGEAIACAGDFGVWIFKHESLKGKDLKGELQNLEDGWTKNAYWETIERECVICKWNPINGRYLAIGTINQTTKDGEVYIVDVTTPPVETQHQRNYKSMGCKGLTSLSWNNKENYLLVTGQQTKKCVVMRHTSTTQHVESIEASKDIVDLCGVFHPCIFAIFVGSSDGVLQVWTKISNTASGERDWTRAKHQEYKFNITGLSTDYNGDFIVCTRADNKISIVLFQQRGEGQSPKMDLIHTIDSEFPLSISWARDIGVGLFATMNLKQIIAIYEASGSGTSRKFSFIFDNKEDTNNSRMLTKLDVMEWHKSKLILATAGEDGFIMFWSVEGLVKQGMLPKERDIMYEKVFYKKKRLQPASTDLVTKGYSNFGTIINTYVKERDTLDAKMVKVRNLASDVMKKHHKGQQVTPEEMLSTIVRIWEVAATEEEEEEED